MKALARLVPVTALAFLAACSSYAVSFGGEIQAVDASSSSVKPGIYAGAEVQPVRVAAGAHLHPVEGSKVIVALRWKNGDKPSVTTISQVGSHPDVKVAGSLGDEGPLESVVLTIQPPRGAPVERSFSVDSDSEVSRSILVVVDGSTK